ncbi:MAG: TIGR03985 family CRISPR-associated protein [Cyanobacteria bacterium J06648_10]
MPVPFRYADVRDRLFSPTHGKSDNDNATTLSADCDATCLCQQSLHTLLEENIPSFSPDDWQQQMAKLTGLSIPQLKDNLQQNPFFTVHRSIRADLAYLADIGWLTKQSQGQFRLHQRKDWPIKPVDSPTSLTRLSTAQTWDVLRALESISFVQPNLETIIQSLWEELTANSKEKTIGTNLSVEPTRRIFIHLDYILSPTMQEQVDTLQEQIEQLWRQQEAGHAVGIIQFDYCFKQGQTTSISVYPVCLHYARRAKYLSAYGKDPEGSFGWHNYRLDRITSPRLTLLPWDSPTVPKSLLKLYKTSKLPTTATVNEALDAAWGFNFYLPRRLLIMRFPSAFAQRYVHETDRHPTFQVIAYEALSTLIKQEIKDSADRAAVLKVLSQRNPDDVYYRAWIRLGDINILMRLRDWRPKGEVIAPLEMRQRMKEEAKAELMHYRKIKK